LPILCDERQLFLIQPSDTGRQKKYQTYNQHRKYELDLVMIAAKDITKKYAHSALSFRPEGTMLSVPEQIADRICNAILSGEIRPGERIQEIPVANMFNVSRGPVREALRLLEHEGLVTFSPRRGAQVTALSIEEVGQLFDIRAALSSLAAQQAAKNRDAESVEALRAVIEALRRSSDKGCTVQEYCALSAQCGQIVAAATGNPKLRAMIQSLSRQTLRYAQLGLSSPERRKESSSLWAKLFKAVEAGDSELAGKISAETIYRSRDAAVKLLREQKNKEKQISPKN
jgi:DNA-binding GntR family transcriptional regulator